MGLMDWHLRNVDRVESAERERALRASEEQRQRIAGLLGTSPQAAVTGEIDRMNFPLLSAQEGTGYLGSDMSREAQAKFMLDTQAEGYAPQQAVSLLSAATPQQADPTTLMQNLQAAGVNLRSPEGQQAMREVLMKPATQINMGTKLPANYMWKDPNDPNAGVVPIPGGPGAKPTAAEAKQMSQGEMSQVMLGEIKRIYDTGIDVSDPMLWGESELAQIPFISWATNLTPDEASLTSNLQQFENQYMAMLRGAQVGPAEQKLFRKQLPQIGQSKELFAENLRNSQRNLLIMIQRISDLRQFDQKGSAAPMVSPTPESVPLPPGAREI